MHILAKFVNALHKSNKTIKTATVKPTLDSDVQNTPKRIPKSTIQLKNSKNKNSENFSKNTPKRSASFTKKLQKFAKVSFDTKYKLQRKRD